MVHRIAASSLLIYGNNMVSVVFRLDSVWFGRPPREPPDLKGQSWLTFFHDVVYVPLVEPVVDDLQDF